MKIENNLNDKIINRRPTIKDIAKLSGVCVATVSLVLNNKGTLSKTTRLKVLAVAEKLDYTPNAIARGLVTRKTKIIGLIVSDITDPFFAELSKGVEDTVFANNYSLILCNSDNNFEKEKLYINLLTEQNVAGLIIVPLINNNNENNLRAATNSNIPIVSVDRKLAIKEISSVTCDNFGGATKAVNHLIQLGHKRIACINIGSTNFSIIHERVRAYKATLRKSQLPIDEHLIVNSNGKITGGIESASLLLELNSPPTAIFAISDIVAFGVIEEVIKRGYKVPDDISVVGFDNIYYSKNYIVPLTTIDQPKYEMGQKIVEVLFDKIRNNNNKDIILETRLIVRKSSGICKYNH